MPFTSHYLTCAGREIHFTEWGARQRRHRDRLAWPGAHRARHGRTGRAPEPARLPGDLPRHAGPRPFASGARTRSTNTAWRSTPAWRVSCSTSSASRRAHWVGTSMGGAIGMVCASGYFEPRSRAASAAWCSTTTRRNWRSAAIERIQAYAGNPPAFATVLELEAFFRQVYKPYGWLSDAQWRRLTETSTRRLPDGRVTPHYDPAMVRQFTDHPDDYRSGSTTTRSRFRCCACAAPSPTWCCPRPSPRCSAAARACAGCCRWWRCRAAAMRRR